MSGSDRPIVIGLTGLAGAGKDTVADALVERAGFVKLAFADALREEIEEAYELERGDALLRDRTTKEAPTERLALRWCTDMHFVRAVYAAAAARGTPMTMEAMDDPRSPRQILQWWGTEYRREMEPDYWTAVLSTRIATSIGQGQWRLVVTDCRFANEAAMLRRAGGELWQVFRPGLRPVEGGHVSQATGDALKPEHFIVNSGSIEGLGLQVLRLLVKRHGGAGLPIHVGGPTP